MMKYIFGITGGSGVGKTTVSNIFRAEGIDIIDTDLISRDVMEPGEECLKETVEYFGETILDLHGRLKRRVLGAVVFSDEKKLNKLNEITHKHITAKVMDRIEHSISDIIGIDGAALIESGIDRICGCVISVMADVSVRVKRIMERDGVSEKDAYIRINAQKKDCFYIEKSDFLVYNNGELDEVYRQVKEVLKKLEQEKEKERKRESDGF